MKNLFYILMLFPVISFANCNLEYREYFKILKSIEKNYKKRNFIEIHYKHRDVFLKKHKYMLENCYKGSKIISDIDYGSSFVTPLTTSYDFYLKKYGYVRKGTRVFKVPEAQKKSSLVPPKVKDIVLRVKPKMLTFLRANNPMKHNPFSGLIANNDPMYEVDAKSILPYLFEENRIIASIVEKLQEQARIMVTTGDFQQKDYFKIKKDTLDYLDEDVLIIEVEE